MIQIVSELDGETWLIRKDKEKANTGMSLHHLQEATVKQMITTPNTATWPEIWSADIFIYILLCKKITEAVILHEYLKMAAFLSE